MCPTDMQYVRASPYLPIIEERQTDWGEAPPIELIYRASLATNTKKNQQLSRVSVRSVCALQVGFYHPSHHYYHTKRRIQKLHILISVLACVALDKKSAFKSLIKMQCTRPRSFFTAKGANLNRLDHHYYSFHVCYEIVEYDTAAKAFQRKLRYEANNLSTRCFPMNHTPLIPI